MGVSIPDTKRKGHLRHLALTASVLKRPGWDGWEGRAFTSGLAFALCMVGELRGVGSESAMLTAWTRAMSLRMQACTNNPVSVALPTLHLQNVQLWCVCCCLSRTLAESICADELSYTTPPSPPFDSISSIRYSPTNPDQLLVSSWDTVRRSLPSRSVCPLTSSVL